MIVYKSTKAGFLADILTNDIENIVRVIFETKLKKKPNLAEIRAWKNSLSSLSHVLGDEEIPKDAGVAIEYQLPQTSKRIDFILTGKNEEGIDHVIIIELKQWDKATLTNKDGIIISYTGGAEREVSHPSYQAWSYAALLKGFNETVYEENIEIKPCAYLHNYDQENVVTNEFYGEYIRKAPLFLKDGLFKFRNYIKQYVKYGDSSDILHRIDNGKIKPSKALAESVASMLKGNTEFVLIDEQKVVYETALTLAKHSDEKSKNVLIIEGGPGTGKSVVAINLLVELTKLGQNARYVTKSAAPRAVYESKLIGTLKKSEISALFDGSGSYTNTDSNSFNTLIVDEAHRLTEKSGMFKNLGENQIKEIMNAAQCSIFFIDEDQKVTINDIGEKEKIISWAKNLNAKVQVLGLESQFRCNGSDGYVSWLDNALQINNTANTILESSEYDFKVIDSPIELRDLIFEKNKINNKSRLVAGYCWDWKSKKNPKVMDILIPEYNFEMKWNLETDGGLWILKPDSVSEVGCIHTCQGLEVDYIGVIVGPDFLIRDGIAITNADKRSKNDTSIRGYKKLFKENPEEAKKTADRIIKNTYRTLMTRGMKGCYVYFTDTETREYFKKLV